MSTLSGHQLRKRLLSENPAERLVVRPLLEPDEQVRNDQASIDIRLGFEFALVTPSSHAAIDEFDESGVSPGKSSLSELYRRHYVPFGGRFVIHPHQFILGSTLEYLRLPSDLMAYVIGRSTWGRLGLIVATAAGIQPSFAGSLTLELRNLGEAPLSLYPGQSIAQLFFHSVAGAEAADEGVGQYSGAVDLLPKAISSKRTRERIEGFIKRRKTR